MAKPTRRMVAKAFPTPMTPDLFDAVVALYKHLLPAMSLKFLRKFLCKEGVKTLVLLLPEDVSSVADDDKDSEPEESADDDEEDDEEDEEEGEEADGEAPSPAPQPETELTPEELAARAKLRRRLAGTVSYEQGERLGQRLVQVSLLGCRLRYQKLGVGSRLVRTLLSGDASAEKPEAGIVWADSGAIPFFKRHGFCDDPILNSRYREITAPWARSTLMSVQLPPPLPDLSGAPGASAAVSAWVKAEPLEEQLSAWRHARLLEYSRELGLVEHLHAEIRSLREKVSLQQG